MVEMFYVAKKWECANVFFWKGRFPQVTHPVERVALYPGTADERGRGVDGDPHGYGLRLAKRYLPPLSTI